MTPLTWSWVLAVSGATGMFLAGRRLRAGWAVAIATECAWIVYAIDTRQWGFIAGAATYIVVFTRNWYAWAPAPNVP
jgi:hypothetical protein